jgi:CBS domain containing-hemolysin-like protein
MTTWDEAFTLCSSTQLDDKVLADILASGCSRVPVWDPGHPDSVCGVLVVKRLLLLGKEPGSLQMNPDLKRQLLARPVIVSEATPLLTLFAALQSARAHLAIVLPSDEDAAAARRLVAAGKTWPDEAQLRISGTLSIEDVFEELVLEGGADDEEALRADTRLASCVRVRDAEAVRTPLERRLASKAARAAKSDC